MFPAPNNPRCNVCDPIPCGYMPPVPCAIRSSLGREIHAECNVRSISFTASSLAFSVGPELGRRMIKISAAKGGRYDVYLVRVSSTFKLERTAVRRGVECCELADTVRELAKK